MGDPLDKCVTPPKLAVRWGVKAEKIIAFIRTGELRAFDISQSPGLGKPRYRISPDAVIEFENRRSTKPHPQLKRKNRAPSDVIEFF